MEFVIAPRVLPRLVGARTAKRANAKWKELLENYEEPPMDPGIREAMADYVSLRETEIGDGEI